MTPFERDVILPTLRDLNEQLGAVKSLMLACCINKSDRMARNYLRRMELAGAVKRPHGPRRGWVALDLQLRTVQGAV